MPKPKKSANTGNNTSRLNQIDAEHQSGAAKQRLIDALTYDEYDRANIPPVGMRSTTWRQVPKKNMSIMTPT
jgi:hypothetical protein